MDKLKKMTSYRLFWPIVCLALVLLFNLIKSPSFFDWQIIVSLFPLVKAKVEQIR